ncbi:hypothetical protein H0H92_014019 [Tricholoma furcatifolium]|nr:hypothetical protein H0H92_014019 [Tricholoma furcatifolium]
MSSADYVIVGGGVTGIALAVRLSEDSSINVTVLEAGSAPFHDEHIDTPGYILHQLGNPTKDWAFFSTPQKHLGDRPVYLPSRSTTGSEGLKYDEEYAEKHGFKFDPKFHGTTGPVQTRIPRFFNPATFPWLEVLQGLGIKHNPDPSAGDITGSWISLTTVDDKSIRSSAASAYYEPNQSRPNLKVISGALATKVLTSGNDTVVATGVEYLKDGVLHTIHAKKERWKLQDSSDIRVIGQAALPQIFSISLILVAGFGDPEVLKKLGIDVVVNLPGDHYMIPFTTKVKKGVDIETFAKVEDPAVAAKHTELFKTKGTGLLAGTPVAYAMLKLKDFDKEGKIAALGKKLVLPDTPIYRLQKEWLHNDRIPFIEMTGYDRFMPGLAAPEPGAQYLSTSIITLHPFNVGSVHITSTDPNTPPAIDHNYLDNEFDLQVLIEAFKFTRTMFNSSPLKDLVEEEVSPGPNYQTDEEITEFIKKVLATCWHPVGTAALLPRQDGGVVDTQFRVYGTKNLRVADASIIPIQIGGHPQATLYAFAEKLADIIKGDST